MKYFVAEVHHDEENYCMPKKCLVPTNVGDRERDYRHIPSLQNKDRPNNITATLRNRVSRVRYPSRFLVLVPPALSQLEQGWTHTHRSADPPASPFSQLH